MPAYQKTYDSWHQWPIRHCTLELSHFYSTPISFRTGSHHDIPIIAVQHAESFDRAGIYDDGQYGFDDNIKRFGILSKAALHWCKKDYWQPDIVHGNDWQSALAIFYLAEHYKNDDFFANTRSVLSLHNAAYQGHSSERWLPTVGVHEKFLNLDDFEDHGHVNLLKGALSFADSVCTVSPGYASELVTEEGGHGIHFKYQNLDNFKGILNGCDYSQWSPETDPYLANSYANPDDDGKAKNKATLQKELNLPISSEIPLLVTICRLAEQKGIQIMIPMLWKLMSIQECQVAILGSGDQELSRQLDELQQHYPNRIRFIDGYDASLSHRMEAGGDAFLMPSIFEPCGLNQIYSLRYGTLPLVRSTGGLKDTVTRLSDSQRNSKSATGFAFDKINDEVFLQETLRMLDVFNNKPKLWKKMQHNAMAKRFDWESATKEYENLYFSVLSKPKRAHKLI
jgi:starch synthase